MNEIQIVVDHSKTEWYDYRGTFIDTIYKVMNEDTGGIYRIALGSSNKGKFKELNHQLQFDYASRKKYKYTISYAFITSDKRVIYKLVGREEIK